MGIRVHALAPESLTTLSCSAGLRIHAWAV
jgi:hypothetical protein